MTFKESPSFRKVVFAAMSKKSFYMREHIIKFILEKGFTPTCAFMMYSYFLLDTVERDSLLSANNELIRRSDELWVFGPISDGVRCEINLAEGLKKPTKYFTLTQSTGEFQEVATDSTHEEMSE